LLNALQIWQERIKKVAYLCKRFKILKKWTL
jgi:hypothetical protein